MDAVAEEYAASGIQSVFVYVREAHPGERIGHHRTMEDKFQAARELRDRFGVRRSILVDDLTGTAHRAYGLLPNMTYVVGGVPAAGQSHAGVVLFRSDWTDASTVRWVCEYLLLTRQRRRNQERIVASYAEIAQYHPSDPRITERIRDVAGEDAYRHTVDALAAWRDLPPEERPNVTVPPGPADAGQPGDPKRARLSC